MLGFSTKLWASTKTLKKGKRTHSLDFGGIVISIVVVPVVKERAISATRANTKARIYGRHSHQVEYSKQ